MSHYQTSSSGGGSRQPASLFRQAFAIIAASAAAVLANVLFYTTLKEIAGVSFIAPNQIPPPDTAPIPVTDVIIFSVVFCLGASIVFLVVANTMAGPARIFAVLSVVVLFVSFILPMKIPSPPVPLLTKLSLASMHIVGAAVLVPLLILIGLPRSASD